MEVIRSSSPKIKINYYHFFFLLLIFFNYFLSFFLFGGFIFATPVDLFDSEILYNKILGQIFLGDFYILESLLNGEYRWFYFTRIFYIINFFYSFLSPETAFLFIDFLVKVFAYISFFRLSKLINNNDNFFSFLLATVYAYTVTTAVDDYHSSIFGFGAAVIPYLTYLVLKNKELRKRNYFFIIFAALNSHFYFALFISIMPIFLHFYKNNINHKLMIKIFSLFFLFCILVNINILYIAIFYETPLNRDNWNAESLPLLQNIKFYFENLLYSPIFFERLIYNNDLYKNIIFLPLFFKKLPITIFYILTILLLLFQKVKKNNLFLFIVFFIPLICFIEKTQLYTFIINNLDLGIIKSIQLSRIKLLFSFILLFALANLKKNIYIKKFTIISLTLIILLFQVNKAIVPFIKDKINYSQLNTEDKRELKNYFINLEFINLFKQLKDFSNLEKNLKESFLTFKDYYKPNSFSKIKNIVNDDFVLPIDFDPAKLIYNNIRTAGGYFQFYPTKYKKLFRDIIKEELKNNNHKRKQFDNHGHRIYAFVNNPSNIKIDFYKAKSIGIKFVISSKNLENNNLKKICENCNNNPEINLYFIK